MDGLIGQTVIPQILDAGYNFDFIDDGAIGHAGIPYKMLVLPGVERMPLESLQKIVAFQKKGGTVIATRRVPSLAPGLMEPTPAAVPAPLSLGGCQAQTSVPAPNDDCQKAAPDEADARDLGFLKTPSSPAFMALGLAPTSVERPTTPKGAAVAVATGIASAVGISPAENFAIELTPY